MSLSHLILSLDIKLQKDNPSNDRMLLLALSIIPTALALLPSLLLKMLLL